MVFIYCIAIKFVSADISIMACSYTVVCDWQLKSLSHGDIGEELNNIQGGINCN